MIKIGRILKAVGRGVAKALPVINVVSEVRDLNVKKVAENIRRDANSLESRDDSFRLKLYDIADALDNGKMDESIDQVVFDKALEVLVSVGTTVALILTLINQL